MATQAIDYRFYPHIIDLILAYASWPVLSTCRLTCKTLLESVRRVQSQHIMLRQLRGFEGYGNPYVEVTTPWGRLPGLDRIRICEKNVDREIARVKPYTRHTTVVDIEGYVDNKYNLTHLAGILKPRYLAPHR